MLRLLGDVWRKIDIEEDVDPVHLFIGEGQRTVRNTSVFDF